MQVAMTGPARPDGVVRPKSAGVPKRHWRVVRIVASSLTVVLVALFAAIGFLHTKAGHPWLMKLAGVAGCPIGGATAAQVDATRRAAIAKDRGTEPAPAHPALGFLLDRSTIADVRAWEARVGASCVEEREATFVKCSSVVASAIDHPSADGALTELAFAFSPSGALVSVSTLYSRRTPEDAARIARQAKVALELDLGPAPSIAGSFDAIGTTATLSYRFRDYAAEVTETQVPGSGFVVREHYMSTL